MSKPRPKVGFRVVFLLFIAGFAVFFNLEKPRVLILHSYTPDYVWTREVNVGIERISKNWGSYYVHWHYMDTKKHQDARWLEQARLLAMRVVDGTQPDVLIVVDDLAQKLVGSKFVNHPGVDIVFAGVNGSVEPYGYEGANNVTGIFEHKQLRAISEAWLALESAQGKSRGNPRVNYLIDTSASLKKGVSFFENYAWKGVDFRGATTIEHFEQWKQVVKDMQQDSDYLLVANYRKLRLSENSKDHPSPEQVMQWTEQNSKIPVVGVNVFNGEEGAVLSVGVAPYEQGETAAKMAERIIEEGISASQIPMQVNQYYIVAHNGAALKKRGIKLPSIYEAFSRATDQYYE